MDIQDQLAEHVRLSLQCREILERAIELSQAGKVEEAVRLQRQAEQLMSRLLEIEDR
jgi:hypothetical protein